MKKCIVCLALTMFMSMNAFALEVPTETVIQNLNGNQQAIKTYQLQPDQDPQILILDEPANHLDLIYQKHIFSLIHDWLHTPGRAVVSVVHDLSLARRYGTHAILLHEGDRKSTRLNSSHIATSRMPSSA